MACSLDRHPGAKNWVERVGGRPEYICNIAKDILESPGSTNDVSRAIAIAVSRVKVWAAGGGGVKPDTRAKAAKAVAEWEAKKARSHASVAASGSIDEDVVELTAVEILEAELAAVHVRENKPRKTLDELTVELAARKFSTEARDKMASKNVAMPDGSYPIPDKDALRRAIQAIGRAPEGKRAAVKAHIKRRARALGATNMLPEGW